MISKIWVSLERILAISVLLISCEIGPFSAQGSTPPSHEDWTALLSVHVSEAGFADYRGFQRDSIKLDQYLEKLSNHPPNQDKWSEEEQLAYWINAYNAYTVKLILMHYPVRSIKDIGSSIQIPFVNSPWDIKFIQIGDKKLDLNNIEHSILRKEFEEPRIHFAINCASFSCPKLRKEAYTAEKLEEQLNEQAIAFINDGQRNILSTEEVHVSKIFRWFKGDFTKHGNLIEFLNQYTEIKLNEKTKISYLKYDWSLNDQSLP